MNFSLRTKPETWRMTPFMPRQEKPDIPPPPPRCNDNDRRSARKATALEGIATFVLFRELSLRMGVGGKLPVFLGGAGPRIRVISGFEILTF